MRSVVDDLRHSVRMLARDPRPGLVAMILLGLGIGAAASIFAVFDALLLRPLPVSDPGSLVRIVREYPVAGARSSFRWTYVQALEARSRSLESIAAASQLNAGYRDGSNPQRVRLELVSASYFDLFEGRARIGRPIQATDEQPGEAMTPVVLSFPFWQRRYAGDPAILGRSVAINNHPFVITGVMERDFYGPGVEATADVWAPVRAAPVFYPNRDEREQWLSFEVMGRLRPGVSRGQAREESFALFRSAIEPEAGVRGSQNESRLRDELEGVFRLESIARGVSRLRPQFASGLWFLLGAAGLLYLMAAASVGGLLLARFTARNLEFSTRLALGATPGRLVRLAVFESAILAVAGGGLGLLVTRALTEVAPRLLPPVRLLDATTMPLALRIELDGRVLAFLVSGVCVAAVLAAAGPALRVARANPGPVLRTSRTTAHAGGRALLVAVQVALCTLLLVLAAQLAFTLRNLRTLDPGFTTDRIVSFTVDPELTGGGREQIYRRIEAWKEQVQALPGVGSAALSSRPLLHGTGIKATIVPFGQIPGPEDRLRVSLHSVSAEYFDTLGLRLLAGRNLLPEEYAARNLDRDRVRPVIANQAFAEHYFPHGNAVGKRIGVNGDQQIAGIVSNAKYRSLREPMQPTLYGPIGEDGAAVLHVRTQGTPESLIGPVRELLRTLAPELPISEVSTMQEEVEDSLAMDKLLARIAAAFGTMAVLIVAVGLYGLLSYVVGQRRREIGIRVAIGAKPSGIFRLISTQTLRLVSIGAALGLAGAFVAGGVTESLLYAVPARNALAGILAALVVLCVAAAATAAPVLHAVRVDPARALREDG